MLIHKEQPPDLLNPNNLKIINRLMINHLNFIRQFFYFNLLNLMTIYQIWLIHYFDSNFLLSHSENHYIQDLMENMFDKNLAEINLFYLTFTLYYQKFKRN